MAEARDAASIILARRTPEGSYEVLLTRRPDSMRFMGGTYVFPGGALHDSDTSEEIAARSGVSASEADKRLGEPIGPDTALGLYCCGLRELFEEVGVLLARDTAGAPVPPELVRDRYRPRRDAIGDDARVLAGLLAADGLLLATDLLVPHGRLITPESSPIRFDARFFVAPFPEGQELSPDAEEVDEVVWMRPPEAIRAARDKSLNIPIPTMSILQGLAEIPGYEQLLRGTRAEGKIVSAPLSPLVSYVLAPNPGLATGPGTNTYVVGDGETAIIDPAVADPRFIEALTRAAGDRGRPSVILLTHLHPDHTGGVGVLAEQLGCEVGAFEGIAGDAEHVTRHIADGEEIRVGGATLRALHTPGHASGHLCYHLVEENALFAGDVVAGLGTVVIAPPDGDMGDYLATLERLEGLGVERIYPGHGPEIADGPAKLAEYIAHRRDRERQVLDALSAGLERIPDMVQRIYADVDPRLHPMAEMSVRAHLEMLEREGRVRRDGETWTPTGAG